MQGGAVRCLPPSYLHSSSIETPSLPRTLRASEPIRRLRGIVHSNENLQDSGRVDRGPRPGHDGLLNPEATPEAAPRVSVITVGPQVVQRDDELPGSVAAVRTAQIRAQVGGIVQRRLFDQGPK